MTRQPDESLSIYDTGRNVGAVVDRVRLQAKQIEITRNGTPAAMVVPVQWWLAAASMANAPQISATALRGALDAAAAAAVADGRADEAAAFGHLSATVAGNPVVVVL